MNIIPLFAKDGQVRRQIVSYPCDVLTVEPPDLAQTGRPCRAMQDKHSFAVCPGHMDMRRPVIVWIDHHPQATQSENSWHGTA